MTVTTTDIRVRGKDIKVRSTSIADRTIVVTGKLLKVATLKDEELVAGELVPDPESFIARLSESGLGADLLEFPGAIDEVTPRYDYPFEWDNAAVARTTSFKEWWEKLPQESRKNVRRAAKRGVEVRVATLDDEFLRGIKGIYDESPVRQGMKFWHYGKDLERIRLENGTYLDRSAFIGAYVGDELIGFMKFVYVDRVARIMQILAKESHFDRRPMNAMIAKAIEVCEQAGAAYLVYSRYAFGNKANSPLAEFKRRNGFEPMMFPRYYVPLTVKGRLALALKLHRGLLGLAPPYVIDRLLRGRAWLLARTSAVSPKRNRPNGEDRTLDVVPAADGRS